MSAFIVARDHIRYLISAAVSRELEDGGCRVFRWYHTTTSDDDDGVPCTLSRELRSGDEEAAVRVGQMLWSENLRSVQCRYEDTKPTELPGTDDIPLYDAHAPWPQPIDPVEVLKAADCYEYQSCEHPGWETSESRSFIMRLRQRAWQHLPGYDDAPWGAPDPTPGRKKQRRVH